MRTLVTGASGFVGASLVRRLIHDGHDVHVFTRPESNLWRLSDLRSHFAGHLADLRDGEAVDAAVREIRPEAVFHLAAHGGFASQNDTCAIVCSNFNGAVNLLKACEKVGFDLFVNTGSSSEYGPKTLPMTEKDLLEPEGDYAVSKAAATLFCSSEAMGRKLPLVTLRIFSPYGPWDDPKRLVSYAMACFLRNESPLLAGPTAVRDYLFIDDVVEAFVRTLTAPIVPGAIYNVGSGKQHTIADVVNLIRGLVPGAPEPRWGVRESARTEPAAWVADIGKIRGDLDWAPSVSLKEGLLRTMEWQRRNMKFYGVN